MLKEFSKKETNRYELVISVDAEAFGEAIKKAYKQNGKKINVPGFRKGKAPMSIIEKYYGESVFYEDALNILYPDAVEDAIAESKLKYVDDKIDFDLVSIDREKGVEFKIVITVMPEVEIDGYKGLKAEKVKAVVTDEEIEAEIKAAQERNSRMITADRAAAKDDTAVIDYDGYVDGKAFDGGKGEAYSLVLGSNSFIPGFEDQIIGHVSGDEFDVNVTFPEEYHAKELAGKAAVFKVKLHEVKVKELPVVDDEFVKDISEFDTLEEYKADLKAKSIERKSNQADADVENQLVEQLIGLVKADIPAAMIERRAEQSVDEFAYRLQTQGMDLKTYLKYMGGTIDDFKNTFMPQAENQVKIRLALEKIVELEKIEPTEEDINAEFEKLAKSYDMEIDKIKAAIPQTELVKDLAVSKAMDLVKSSAVIKEVDKKTEKTETEKKPAAKKSTTTAKKTTTKKADGETAAKKPAAKKTTTTAKKPATKKAEGETAAKKPAAKKTTTTTAAKKPAAKKTTAKKDAE